jgi:segregation and condensation protein A
MLGQTLDWTTLQHFLPPGLQRGLQRRAAVAATFAASLELARTGRIELRQDGLFAPIFMRRGKGPQIGEVPPSSGGEPTNTEGLQ